ncbi:MAG: hypothetical protein VX589_10175 [Myxococcota bacterium]|nr:hypothetical protein [Myxococcota bacterium]
MNGRCVLAQMRHIPMYAPVILMAFLMALIGATGGGHSSWPRRVELPSCRCATILGACEARGKAQSVGVARTRLAPEMPTTDSSFARRWGPLFSPTLTFARCKAVRPVEAMSSTGLRLGFACGFLGTGHDLSNARKPGIGSLKSSVFRGLLGGSLVIVMLPQLYPVSDGSLGRSRLMHGVRA